MKMRVLRDWKPARPMVLATPTGAARQPTVIYRRSMRVALPIAIKSDAAPKKRGFSRSRIAPDAKTRRR